MNYHNTHQGLKEKNIHLFADLLIIEDTLLIEENNVCLTYIKCIKDFNKFSKYRKFMLNLKEGDEITIKRIYKDNTQISYNHNMTVVKIIDNRHNLIVDMISSEPFERNVYSYKLINLISYNFTGIMNIGKTEIHINMTIPIF